MVHRRGARALGVSPGFVFLPATDRYWLGGGRVPVALLAHPLAGIETDGDGLGLVDIEVAGSTVARIVPSGETPMSGAVVQLDGGQVWPGFVDVHTHLDKGHTWQRAPNPDGTFAGARSTVMADRLARWPDDDVLRRMDFGLRCSYAHGTVAVRTHLDSYAAQADITWRVVRELRRAWAGRVELQAVSLVTLETFTGPDGKHLADLVAGAGGVIGGIPFMNPALDAQLDRVVVLAAERGLDLDFHVDENGDPGARVLAHVARAVLRHGFEGGVACGHCCSLAVQPPDVVDETLDLVARAGIAVVTLPMCNLYLQDRAPGRTPRWRGVTLLHEMRARSIPVAVASDNCRDPFYGFGDHDMLEVYREATRIAHLDRPYADWPRAVTTTPADLMRLPTAGRLGAGLPADLVLFRGRHFSELLARPQSDRVVVRDGRALDVALPDHRELDDLMRRRSDGENPR
jgi:cytosine deaminase